MPLWLSEEDVAVLATPADAVPVIEACFERMAAGDVELMPRRRFPVDGGYFAVMAAADRGLGVAGLKSYTLVDGSLAFVVCLFDLASGELVATIAADRLGQLRTGAASGVAARHLARAGAASVGLIGVGWQARSQLAAIRAAVPTIERAVAWSRTPERVGSFCEETGAQPAGAAAEAAACDVVVTVTTAREPVLRGEWLADGALVCAVGANDPRARELDDRAIERAALVCCDSLEDARLESGDLIEPIAGGLLAWEDVHELHEVVAGRVERPADDAVVLFKSNGIAAWDVALADELVRRARERGVGTAL